MSMADFIAHNDSVWVLVIVGGPYRRSRCEKIFGRAHPEESTVEEVFWRVVNFGSARDESSPAEAAYDDIW